MGVYVGEFIIYDERNGEIVDVLRDVEIEDDSISEEGVEQIEEFVSLAINKYEEDVWPPN